VRDSYDRRNTEAMERLVSLGESAAQAIGPLIAQLVQAIGPVLAELGAMVKAHGELMVAVTERMEALAGSMTFVPSERVDTPED